MTRLRRAPDLVLTWPEDMSDRHFVKRLSSGAKVSVGPLALALLDLFGSGAEVEDVLDLPVGDGTREDRLAVVERLLGLGFLVPTSAGSGPTRAPFRTFEEFDYHFRMLTDRRRVEAFSRAIAEKIRPGMRVLEIGAGTGILSVLAARAGAEVLAMERGDVIDMARHTIERAGVAHQVRLVQGDSRHLAPIDRCDLLLCELVGNRVLNEGLLETVLDARSRHLRPDAEVLPEEVRILGYAAHLDLADRCLGDLERAERESGVTTEPMRNWLDERSRAGDLVMDVAFDEGECLLRSGEAELCRVDLRTFTETSVDEQARIVVEEAGTVNGILIAFELSMCPGVTLDNRPQGAPTHWLNGFIPLGGSRRVQPGEELELSVSYRTDGDLQLAVIDRPSRPDA